jgi:hypothetical protein
MAYGVMKAKLMCGGMVNVVCFSDNSSYIHVHDYCDSKVELSSPSSGEGSI